MLQLGNYIFDWGCCSSTALMVAPSLVMKASVVRGRVNAPALTLALQLT